MSVTRESLHRLVIDNKDELIGLCSSLIKLKNQSPVDDQRQAIEFVRDYLASKDIASDQVGDDPEYPILIAHIGNEDGEGFRVVLNGHVDVVPVGDLSGWDFDPFGGIVTEDKILGRGASDMKCGLAILLFVMGLLKQADAPLKGDIRLHVVSDEEIAGKGTAWLCRNGYADGADAVIIGEPTGHDNIEIGQKGILHLTLVAKGTPGHGATANYKGDSAILKLAALLPHIQELTEIPGHYPDSEAIALRNSRIIAEGTLHTPEAANLIDHVATNVGLISGGTKVNQVPDHAEAVVDVRMPYGTDHQQIVDKVNQIITESGVQGVTAEYDWIAEGNYTNYDSLLVASFKKNIEAVRGKECLPAYQWASSDAKHYRDLGCPTIQFGPANNEGIHGYNEDVDILDVVNAAQIYMLSLCDMLGIE